MPPRFPTRTTGSALALAALFAPAMVAAHALLREGDSSTAISRKPAHPAVRVTGNVARPLTPGTFQRLNLRLSNRSGRRLLVTKLTISLKVDARHRRAGCSRARSFRVTRIKRREYPLSLRPRRKRSLRALGVGRVPRLRMLNLRTNQDACKGAKLRLAYRLRVQRARQIHAP